MKTKYNPFLRFAAATFAAVTLASLANQSAHAVSGSWILAGDGNWGVDANWNGAGTFPNGEGQAANFAGNVTDVLYTTTLDGNYTVSSSGINTGSASDWLVTSATNTLTFDHTGTNNASISNSFNGASTYTLDTNIILNSNLVINGNGNNGAQVKLGSTAGGRTITGSGNITINNTNSNSGGVVTINSNINTTGAVSNTSTQGQNNHSVAGVIGSTVTGVTQNSSKNFSLSGNNVYTGPTTVTLGNLIANVATVTGVSGAFGLNSAVTIGNAASTSLNLNNFNNQIGSLAGGGTAGGNVTLGTATLTTGANNADTTFGGIISGAGGLTKIGSGTQTLGGANSFTGPITLSGGGLAITTASAARTFSSATQPFNVTAASTLGWNNTSTTTQLLTFSGTAAFTLGDKLTVQNTSTTVANVNGINFARNIGGTGNLEIETYNNISAIGDNFSLGRVAFSGNNSGWSGDIVISKGTVSLSGTVATNNLNAAGTGDIKLGTTGDLFGAGLTFFPGANVTYNNDITVNTGGFRAIKGGGNNFNVTLAGNVTLNKNLTLDHTWGATDKRISLNGAISGTGGLTITRAGGDPGTTVVLNGACSYTGPTTVTDGASFSTSRTCSLTSNITVETGARIGGTGSTTGSLTLDTGAKYFFFFSAGYAPMNVSGTVTIDSSFDIINGLVGGSQGELIPWGNVAPGTYTLIGGTSSTFNDITNFGVANQVVDVGGISGKNAYFQNGGGTSGGGLQLVVTGPSLFDDWKTTNGATGGFQDDHDGDGVENGVEYYLKGNVVTTGFTALPGVVDTAGVRSVTWPAASISTGYAGVYGQHFIVETSDTLAPGSWVTAPIGTGPDTVSIPFATAAQIRNVKYTFPSTGPKKFARLRVTGP